MKVRFILGRSNVVTDTLPRNAQVGEVSDTPSITNISLTDLGPAQRNQYIWKKVIYASEAGGETTLPQLPLPFSQFFLS